MYKIVKVSLDYKERTIHKSESNLDEINLSVDETFTLGKNNYKVIRIHKDLKISGMSGGLVIENKIVYVRQK